jgi:hypothetical protein
VRCNTSKRIELGPFSHKIFAHKLLMVDIAASNPAAGGHNASRFVVYNCNKKEPFPSCMVNDVASLISHFVIKTNPKHSQHNLVDLIDNNQKLCHQLL